MRGSSSARLCCLGTAACWKVTAGHDLRPVRMSARQQTCTPSSKGWSWGGGSSVGSSSSFCCPLWACCKAWLLACSSTANTAGSAGKPADSPRWLTGAKKLLLLVLKGDREHGDVHGQQFGEVGDPARLDKSSQAQPTLQLHARLEMPHT